MRAPVLSALGLLSSALFSTSACSTSPEVASPTAEPAPQAAAAPAKAAGAMATKPEAATATPVKPLEKKQFGAPITEKTTTALMEIVRDPSKHAGKTVRTEGVVTAVCKSMGCWMEIGDETGTAHIKMAGHSFFVPREASGHRAVVQGTVLSSGGGDTCAEKDGCRQQAEKETGRIASVELEATGVQFLD